VIHRTIERGQISAAGRPTLGRSRISQATSNACKETILWSGASELCGLWQSEAARADITFWCEGAQSEKTKASKGG
jgi:hypothetical protein